MFKVVIGGRTFFGDSVEFIENGLVNIEQELSDDVSCFTTVYYSSNVRSVFVIPLDDNDLGD